MAESVIEASENSRPLQVQQGKGTSQTAGAAGLLRVEFVLTHHLLSCFLREQLSKGLAHESRSCWVLLSFCIQSMYTEIRYSTMVACGLWYTPVVL